MTAIALMFSTSLRCIIRDRQLVLGAVASPVVFLLAFAAFDLDLTDAGLTTATAAPAEPRGLDYYDFVVPGLLAMTAMEFSVGWTSAAYARFQDTNVLRRLAITPIRPSTFLIGQVAARILVSAVQAITVVTLAWALGATYAGSPLLLVALTLLAGVAFLALGFAIGARASSVESAQVLTGIAVMPLVFLSGAFFPVSGLPDWLESVVTVLPMAPLLSAMRAVAHDGAGLADIGGRLLLVLAWIPAMLGVATLALRPRTQPSWRRSRGTERPAVAATAP